MGNQILDKRLVSLTRKIQMRVKDGRPLNISCVLLEEQELIEEAFAIRPFVGWYRAVEISGCDYGEIPHEYNKHIECPECGREYLNLVNHMKGAHSSSPDDYDLPNQSEELIIRRHGDLRKKVSPMKHWEACWSKEYVADFFVKFYLHERIDESRGNAFHLALTRFWGGGGEIVRELGVYSSKLRGQVYESEEDVILAIQRRSQQGISLVQSTLTRGKHRDTTLLEKGGSYFGNWRTAVKAAGFELPACNREPRTWTPENLDSEFRKALQKYGPNLKYGELQKIDSGLVEAIRKRHGCFDKAKSKILSDSLITSNKKLLSEVIDAESKLS